MLPRDSGGVVDTNLVVYGTKNVRVVDASIMPLQVSAHLMAPAYGSFLLLPFFRSIPSEWPTLIFLCISSLSTGVAEKAADIVRLFLFFSTLVSLLLFSQAHFPSFPTSPLPPTDQESLRTRHHRIFVRCRCHRYQQRFVQPFSFGERWSWSWSRSWKLERYRLDFFPFCWS